MSEIVKCTCQNVGQDAIYGSGFRLANEASKDIQGLRCTVCGTSHHSAKPVVVMQKKAKQATQSAKKTKSKRINR